MFGDERGDHGRIPRRRSLTLAFTNRFTFLTEDKVGLREATRRFVRRAIPNGLLRSTCSNLLCSGLHAALYKCADKN